MTVTYNIIGFFFFLKRHNAELIFNRQWKLKLQDVPKYTLCQAEKVYYNDYYHPPTMCFLLIAFRGIFGLFQVAASCVSCVFCQLIKHDGVSLDFSVETDLRHRKCKILNEQVATLITLCSVN